LIRPRTALDQLVDEILLLLDLDL